MSSFPRLKPGSKSKKLEIFFNAMAKRTAPKKPSPEDVKAQIAALKTIKPKVLKSSMFGDNHHDAIDAQILVLERNMTDNQIFDNGPKDDDEENDVEPMWTESVMNAALDARRWLDGERTDGKDLATDWKDLVR